MWPIGCVLTRSAFSWVVSPGRARALGRQIVRLAGKNRIVPAEAERDALPFDGELVLSLNDDCSHGHVFGNIALAITEGVVEPRFGSFGRLAGALTLGSGVVILIVGRSELFHENFFDPLAIPLRWARLESATARNAAVGAQPHRRARDC